MKPISFRGAALCGLSLLALTPVARAAEAVLQPWAVAAADSPAQPVVVTATRFPEDANRLPFGVSVITADDLQRSGASTVNEALMQLLGLPGRADFFGGGEYNLDLRGFGETADQNQVVIVDGLRVSEADLGGTRLAQIPVESVERIEVVRGNAAVLYGEGATGGAIVITTKAGGDAARNGGQVRASAGSYGLRELRGSVSAGADGFSLDAAAQRRNADNYRDNARSELEAGSVGAQWRGGAWRIGARLSADQLDARLPGGLTVAQYAADPRQASTPGSFASIRNNRQNVFAEGQVAGWTLGLDLGWRGKALRSFNSAGASSYTYDYDIDANSQAVRARTDLSIGGMKHRLVLGVDRNDWQRRAVSGSSFGPYATAASQQSIGVYAKDDMALGSSTQLSAGVRSEKFRKNFNNDFSIARLQDRLPAWDLGLTQSLAGGWAVYGRVGRSFRLANADEYSADPAVVLRPQTSRDIELGTRWTHAQGRVEARVYRSALRDEIGYDPTPVGGSPFGANLNFDRTRRQGLEIEARHALTPALDLRVNAAWRQAEFTAGTNKGRDLPLTPHASLAVNLDWSPAPQHRVGAGVQLVSSQHPGNDTANQCRIPGYGTLQGRYAYQWSNAEFALGVRNLADRRYYTYAFGCANGAPLSVYPEFGRAATASVTVRF